MTHKSRLCKLYGIEIDSRKRKLIIASTSYSTHNKKEINIDNWLEVKKEKYEGNISTRYKDTIRRTK